eukprot:2378665-Amphidinium_carterae.1
MVIRRTCNPCTSSSEWTFGRTTLRARVNCSGQRPVSLAWLKTTTNGASASIGSDLNISTVT